MVNITPTNPKTIISIFEKPSSRSGTHPHPFINNPNLKNKPQPPPQKNFPDTIFDKLPSTISQIENGDRKISAEELVRFARLFNVSPNSLLNLEKEIKVILEQSEYKKEKEKKVRINVPQKNLEKFKEVILYILNKVGSKPNVGETVLYKLLYFIDFDYYEKYEEQLMGATYIKNNYGPTPVEFGKIIKAMKQKGEIIEVDSKYFGYPQRKYLPVRKANLTILNKSQETKMIDDVLERLADKNASEISEYSHEDVPWLTTDEGEYIEYESVFYRTPPYSVRDYSEG